jgi:hypothetical protein
LQFLFPESVEAEVSGIVRDMGNRPSVTAGGHPLLIRFVSLVVLCLLVTAGCLGENAAGAFPAGEWAFNHAPETVVLAVREDGSAVYDGKGFTWESDGCFLTLTDAEGEKSSFRYAVEDESVRIFLPGEYTRVDKLTDEEIWGVWVKDGSQMSSFVFEKDGRFMEDGTFVGSYTVDPEAETILLKYQPAGYFNDTLCYFIREADHMAVYYPWILIAAQADP